MCGGGEGGSNNNKNGRKENGKVNLRNYIKGELKIASKNHYSYDV